ncbi:MAG: MBL fold metallo-hydrolase [Lentimicrobiaceae bacterium]|nr:MBL fold metallo-hydrolase [Lentimicrobiaceae bacterium]
MITIKSFVFNPFQVNTFVLSDETGECVIIDPGCNESWEKQSLSAYIEDKNLKPVALINTHFHVDHILGNHYVCEKYKLEPTGHKAGRMFWETAKEYGSVFNLELDEIRRPVHLVEDGDTIKFGQSELEVRYTPGHADGSICLVSTDNKFVIAGDVLFQASIGRTDLPTGDFDLLMKSIREKLFTLPDDTIVYPGHGPKTSIGFERLHNPFIE